LWNPSRRTCVPRLDRGRRYSGVAAWILPRWRGRFYPDAIVGHLGKPWMFASPGDLIKRFPCGTIQQQVMDAMLRLIAHNNIKAAEVDRVEVGGNQSNLNTLFRHHPTTASKRNSAWNFA